MPILHIEPTELLLRDLAYVYEAIDGTMQENKLRSEDYSRLLAARRRIGALMRLYWSEAAVDIALLAWAEQYLNRRYE